MSEEKKPFKIVFHPEALKSLEDLPQEEAQAVIDQITAMFASGEAFELSEPVDFDKLKEESPEEYEALMRSIESMDPDTGEHIDHKIN